jgi:hypothetical protein
MQLQAKTRLVRTGFKIAAKTGFETRFTAIKIIKTDKSFS